MLVLNIGGLRLRQFYQFVSETPQAVLKLALIIVDAAVAVLFALVPGP